MSIYLPDDDIALASVKDTQKICEPFFQATGINTFLYARIYDDNTSYAFNSNPVWQAHHFRCQYLVTPPIPKNLIKENIVFLLTSENVPSQFAQTLRTLLKFLG